MSGSGQERSKDLFPRKGGQFLTNFDNSVQNYVSFIPESFYAQGDDCAWWIDSGATSHVCKDKGWFEDLELMEVGSFLRMGEESMAPILGKGVVDLEFTPGKTITLFDVLYVLKVRKNLVSGSMLNNLGFKLAIESDKYILSKCGVFVGFEY
ncbi:unnamed protein product [Cuscuta epithymum]|uniref:Retrovirus-related Pol polyprotein from transposon TNT 1-94-like beta-barrel domain-containing protein n=1 Tax=Cuscuta epithymum TaxID=186058 RepID=A0AAV0FRG5_9ASTE|nr:unnamed protein product [Cuscuta epithymum]